MRATISMPSTLIQSVRSSSSSATASGEYGSGSAARLDSGTASPTSTPSHAVSEAVTRSSSTDAVSCPCRAQMRSASNFDG